MTQKIIIIGAGIVGVSTGIWLRRFGADVTILDRAAPGQGTSYGNAGVLAACSMVPVTTPGLLRKAPGMLMNRDFPLFLRASYSPKLAPWLMKYLSHANDADTRRIAEGLTPIVADTVEQHKALTDGTDAAHWISDSDYHFAYVSRAAFDADSYVWSLRHQTGFVPTLHEGAAVQGQEPNLSGAIGCLASVKDHGFIRDPGGYVASLAEVFTQMGGDIRQTEVVDFDLSGGRITSVITKDGAMLCDAAVLATGVWSKPLMKKLGISVPLESERGYHIVFEGAENGPLAPTMVASGKFVATPMAAGLRCAGIVEFGGLEAGPSKAPFELLRRKVAEAYPSLTHTRQDEWMGHRPAPSDSLPLIGEIAQSGVMTAFGHHHIGLTGGPKTGRLVAELLSGRRPNIDMQVYTPNRFAQS
ncbi:D-amino acid dehydrogenase 1 [Roseobacter fucihabitans]|uniref:D-amino acid dehydrogenase 1 n=1 Tax=Roseobacter fucihabitans TaxID=1537242 RepID=A0ABZ2BMZ1_9RHOB|nr:FAD-dependent oxidoreductase [Roseobacter litoralis]MBC6964629.1 D-amino acid dehydrogenase small subunit [Roseobacter litoralis]